MRPPPEFVNTLKRNLIRTRGDASQVCLKYAGIPARYFDANFDNLDASGDPEAFNACREFANAGSFEGKTSLLLRGPVGNGKTTLAVATLRCIVESRRGDVDATFRTMTGLLDEIKRGFKSDRESVDIRKLVEGHDLMILDDLGKERPTDWVNDGLEQLFEAVYQEEKQLIITTNFEINQLIARFSESIVSRICGMCADVPFTGEDLRMIAY